MRLILMTTLLLLILLFTGVAVVLGWTIPSSNLSFVMTDNGEPSIYLTDIRTRLTIRLVESAYSPAWSPDGNQLAFVSYRDGGSDVFRLDMRNRVPVNLTPDNRGWDGDPSWSPDGQRLVFVSDRGSFSFTHPDFDIFVMDVADETIFNLSGQRGQEHSPVWSPDSQRIAYISNLDRIVSLYISDMHDVSQANPRPDNYVIAYDVAERQQPIWSNNGEYLLYTITRNDTYYLHTIDVEDAESDRLATNAFNPAWSPDGEQLVYVRYERGRSRMQLHDGVALAADLDANQPVWSPDGGYLAFIADDVYLMNTLNRNIQRLTFLNGRKIALDWRP